MLEQMKRARQKRFIFALVVSFLASCGVLIPPPFTPFEAASTSASDAVTAQYQLQMSALFAAYDADRLRHFAGLGHSSDSEVPDWIRSEVDGADAQSAMMAHPTIPPLTDVASGSYSYDGQWRVAEALLYLDRDPPAIQTEFHFPTVNAFETRILLRSLSPVPARITLTCDGAVFLTEMGDERALGAGEVATFVLPRLSRDEVFLRIPHGIAACDMQVKFDRELARTLRLEPEEADLNLAEIDERFDACAIPRMDRMDALEQAFFAGRWLSQTCAMAPGAIRLLPEGRDGFNAKVEALSGASLPDAVFDTGDPGLPLDVSRAPRLDMIVLSYLDIKADFSGFIMEQLLRFHAERGTAVRILVSDALTRDLDRAMIEGLAADFPNVQLQLYNWIPPHFAPFDEQLSAFHRVQHVKLFATLAEDPARSRAILGGRNIHDGFLFDHALDLSAFPALNSYGEPGEMSLNYFATYHDFEVELEGDTVVRTLLAHLATLWHRDAATSLYRPFSVTALEQVPGQVPLNGARHFISVPYLDGGAMEDYWVSLFDVAERSLVIVTPYLNPTPAIEAALIRALQRGVAVTIVARVHLEGDLGGRLMTEMNMLFVERYAELLNLWEYDAPNVVLHSKLLIIDGRLSVVTSTNLNRRSFLHDTENGLSVLDPGFAARLAAVVDDYITHSRRLATQEVVVRPAVRQLFALPWVRDLF